MITIILHLHTQDGNHFSHWWLLHNLVKECDFLFVVIQGMLSSFPISKKRVNTNFSQMFICSISFLQFLWAHITLLQYVLHQLHPKIKGKKRSLLHRKSTIANWGYVPSSTTYVYNKHLALYNGYSHKLIIKKNELNSSKQNFYCKHEGGSSKMQRTHKLKIFKMGWGGQSANLDGNFGSNYFLVILTECCHFFSAQNME